MSDDHFSAGTRAAAPLPHRVAGVARSINVAEVVSEAEIGRLQVLVVAVCALVTILDGFDLQAIAFAGPVIARQWGIEATALGVIFSAALVGMTLGAALIGMLGDHFGRKVAVGLSVATFGVFTLATASAGSYNELLAYRFLSGLGIGGAIPSVTTLTAEYAPARLRVRMIAVMSVGLPLGGVFGGVLAAQMIPLWGWESVFYVGGIFPLLLLPLIVKVLPESIHFLVTKREEEATTTVTQLLNRINPSGRYTQSDSFLVPEAHLPGLPVKHLFSSGLAHNTLLLWLAFFINLLALYFLMSWLPEILVAAGFLISKAINVSALFSLGGAIGALLLAELMSKYGSRQMLTVFFSLAALLCVGVVRLGGSSSLFLMLVIFLSGFLTISAQVGMNATAAGIYPTDIRATGVGWALGLGRVGAITGPVIGGVLASLRLDIQGYFLIFGLLLTIAAVAIALLHFDDKPALRPGGKPVRAAG
ncbi:MAG TPA: MFS transporter [Candidatus Binatia bacterium]|jgi:AAHS family 4-hydroxybenzoate transporter-like MFS transporter|nr:MFS transporter [Candidatus Binatia bacterium]